MKINEILSAIRSLAQSQGFYSRLYSDLLRELAEIIGFSLNTFCFDSSGFVEVMLREHRTIQQSFMREVIVPYLLGLSEVKSYDERNEASVRLATAIMARVTDDELCLPFI